MMVRRIIFSLIVGGLLVQAPARDASAQPLTAEEKQELDALTKQVEQFRKASGNYRKTVNRIVKRSYQRQRQEMLNGFESRIRDGESQERTRRMMAITLFADFLRRYPNDARWTPDVIFRLAELYFEKSNDEYLAANEQYENELRRFDKKEIATAPPPPKQDYQPTIELHRRLIRDFPRYRLADGAYYLLGFCLSEMSQEQKGKTAFLSLVCSNRFSPPLDETPDAPAGSSPSGPIASTTLEGSDAANSFYDTCVPLFPKSRFNAEAWIRIGEHHFDENELAPAIAAYQRVIAIGPKDNPYFDEALYKLAWTHYRADRFVEAIQQFDRLVLYADEEFEKTGKYGSEMRPEAIQYLGISFAEEDWDGDTVPDKETGLERIDKMYGGREKEKHVVEVYQRLGDIYFDTTKYDEAIKIYKVILQRWPDAPNNPNVQEKIILSLERMRRFEEGIKERERIVALFGKSSRWEKKNRNNSKALRKAKELEEEALIQAAVFHHKAAQELKKRGVAMSDVSLIHKAAGEYALAASAYEKYLDRFPDSKHSYEIRYSYASALYYSQRFLEAGVAFAEVRDSTLDNRYQEDSAFMTTKAYEQHINAQVLAGKIVRPPLPDPKAPPAALKSIAYPDAVQRWQDSLDAYAKSLPGGSKTPRLKYKAAEIAYRYIHFDQARKRFEEIYSAYCSDAMAANAGQAILVSYQLEKNLDQMEIWATKLKGGKCGGSQGKKLGSDVGALLTGIKFKRAQQLMKDKKWDEAAAAYLALVDANPSSADADKALNNAAVAYEKSQRFESATKIYERLWQTYKDSPLAGNALWRAAINYQRFFSFGQAVQNFLILADSPRFTSSPNRSDAIFNAAVILENDQDYDRAAKLFLRYSAMIEKKKDAAEAYFRAGMIYGKMDDFLKMVKTLRDYSRQFASVPGLQRNAVEAPYRIAESARKRRDWVTATRYYQQAISQFRSLGLAPASEAAEYAAQAAFRLAERRLETFLKTSVKGPISKLLKREQQSAKDALALKKEYDAIFAYKRARWTLAAMCRGGSIYEHFAKTLAAGYREAPVPSKVKRLGQDAVDMYQQQLDQLLEQRVSPVEKQAKRFFEMCVKQAKNFGVSNEYTDDGMRRLNAMDPTAYPLRKSAIVEESLD